MRTCMNPTTARCAGVNPRDDGVTISDGDVGDVVRSVQVELVMGGEGDRLVLNEELCMDSSESTCHLRYVRI